MPKLAGVTPDRMADEFVTYLFERYRGSRHVRRVASWIGFIVAGIEQLRDSDECFSAQQKWTTSAPQI